MGSLKQWAGIAIHVGKNKTKQKQKIGFPHGAVNMQIPWLKAKMWQAIS